MGNGIGNMVGLASAFLALFALAELLYHWRGMTAESTRKLVHVGTGLLALLFPVALQSHWQALLLCSLFAVLLVLSIRFGLLPSVNAIRRESYGSLGYPVAVYGSYLAYACFGGFHYFYLPVLILAICDPVAAYVGRKTRFRPYRVGAGLKTVGGSLAFFGTAILLVAAIYLYLGNFPGIGRFMGIALVIATFSTLAEAVSAKGLDNVTIPAVVLAGLVLMEHLIV